MIPDHPTAADAAARRAELFDPPRRPGSLGCIAHFEVEAFLGRGASGSAYWRAGRIRNQLLRIRSKTQAMTPTPTCQICGSAADPFIVAGVIRRSIADLIRAEFPNCSSSGFICLPHLNRFRSQFVENLLLAEKGELTSHEREVVAALERHETFTQHVDEEYDQGLTFDERLTDQIALFGGSWKFLDFFFVILVVWIAANFVVNIWQPFDPYPYILLNLILSCLAAIQVTAIMMSQYR